jgi:hypothetical protein
MREGTKTLEMPKNVLAKVVPGINSAAERYMGWTPPQRVRQSNDAMIAPDEDPPPRLAL